MWMAIIGMGFVRVDSDQTPKVRVFPFPRFFAVPSEWARWARTRRASPVPGQRSSEGQVVVGQTLLLELL